MITGRHAAVTSVVLLLACGDNAAPPALGASLHIEMRTLGASFDGDGYQYQVGPSSLTLSVRDTLQIDDLPAGPIPLALGGIADNCRAFSPGPPTLTLGTGAVDTVSLVVSCDSALRSVVLFGRTPDPQHPEVWMTRPDGSGVARLLTDASDATATPNGTNLLFFDWTTFKVGIVRSDGTKRRLLTPTLGGASYEPDVSPDGRYVAFARSTTVGADIYRVNLDGKELLQLTQGAFDGQPRWSPDGSTSCSPAGEVMGDLPSARRGRRGSPAHTTDNELLRTVVA